MTLKDLQEEVEKKFNMYYARQSIIPEIESQNEILDFLHGQTSLAYEFGKQSAFSENIPTNMTLKDLQERVKQQVYTKPFDLDDAKECWKVAKKAMDKMISVAVEQGRRGMLEEVLKEIEGIPKKKSAKDMPYGNIDAYVGFNTALNSLKEKLTSNK